MDDKSLPKITNFSHFLTEHQKQQLGCQSREESTLVEKYRFYRALIFSKKSLVFLVQKSEEDNKTLSSFAEEFFEVREKQWKKVLIPRVFYNLCEKLFQAKSSWQGKKKRLSGIEKENQELLEKGFHLGAYDWRNLQACTKYFYFSRVLQEPFSNGSLIFRGSVRSNWESYVIVF